MLLTVSFNLVRLKERKICSRMKVVSSVLIFKEFSEVLSIFLGPRRLPSASSKSKEKNFFDENDFFVPFDATMHPLSNNNKKSGK